MRPLAKIVYDRPINYSNNPVASGALTFLISREVAHQKMFEAALASITENIGTDRLTGDGALGHPSIEDVSDGGRGSPDPGLRSPRQIATGNSCSTGIPWNVRRSEVL